jgi:deoxyribonuclease-4
VCELLAESDCAQFQEALSEYSIGHPIAHASYLINLATPDDKLWNRSLAALVNEWRKCEELQLEGLVLHPGAHTSSTPEAGLARIAEAVGVALQQVVPRHSRLLLENTAGQGSCLGWRIEQLGWLLKAIRSRRLGICWDTCHALAAGYDFRTAKGLKAMLSEMEQHGILSRICAIHVNDSQKDRGSRVDRHEHIGQGFIGESGFRRFLRCSAFRSLPMYLETPKGTDTETGEDWDARNLAVLRDLSSPRRRTTVA